MQRRDFLKHTFQAGAMVPLVSSGLFARPLEGFFAPRAAAMEDRVLVLINLNGGNDGLNMVVPVNDQRYHDARPSIRLSAGETLPITDGLAFHNAMSGLHGLFNSGQCAVVQSVGYPNQDRSHFRSTDIWHTASDADEIWHTGWLGRYLERSHPEYPGTLPNAPFAMQVGSSATLALQGESGGMGMAIDNPDRFYNLANGLSVPDDPLPGTLAGPELKFVRDVIAQSNRYSSEIRNAMIGGSTNVQYDADGFSAQLRVVARLINGGLRTGVYVVTLGGFDTHNGQMVSHAARLTQLSRGVSTFLADIGAAGNADRVACMTYSEFGRRVNENGSAGTDHGAASPQLVIGKGVLGGTVIGGAPNLVDLDNRGDIKFVNDFRQIYASVLRDWLGFAPAYAETALGGNFERLPLFNAPTVGVPDESDARMAGVELLGNMPNPASTATTLAFRIPERSRVRIGLFAADGKALRSILDRTVEAGEHRLPVDVSALPSGSYLYTMENGRYRISKRMTVVR